MQTLLPAGVFWIFGIKLLLSRTPIEALVFPSLSPGTCRYVGFLLCGSTRGKFPGHEKKRKDAPNGAG